MILHFPYFQLKSRSLPGCCSLFSHSVQLSWTSSFQHFLGLPIQPHQGGVQEACPGTRGPHQGGWEVWTSCSWITTSEKHYPWCPCNVTEACQSGQPYNVRCTMVFGHAQIKKEYFNDFLYEDDIAGSPASLSVPYVWCVLSLTCERQRSSKENNQIKTRSLADSESFVKSLPTGHILHLV